MKVSAHIFGSGRARLPNGLETNSDSDVCGHAMRQDLFGRRAVGTSVVQLPDLSSPSRLENRCLRTLRMLGQRLGVSVPSVVLRRPHTSRAVGKCFGRLGASPYQSGIGPALMTNTKNFVTCSKYPIVSI